MKRLLNSAATYNDTTLDNFLVTYWYTKQRKLDEHSCN